MTLSRLPLQRHANQGDMRLRHGLKRLNPAESFAVPSGRNFEVAASSVQMVIGILLSC